MATLAAPIPDHIPANLVRDVDIFNIQSVNPDIHRGWKQIQDDSPPLLWTPRYGGHWIPMRAAAIERVFSDAEHFKNGGVWVPPTPPGMIPQIPIQSDGEMHRAYRSLIMPFLLGKKLKGAIDTARALAASLIDGFIDKGECDFAVDFSQHLPIQVFLTLVDLPSEDRPYLASLAEVVRTPDPEKKIKAFNDMVAYLDEYIRERRANPGEDIISAIVNGKVLGRPLTEEEVLGECVQVLVGGLDTVASMMGFIAAHLAVNAELRHRLAAEPKLIEQKIDEIIRRFGVAGPARQVAKDIEVEGILMKAGDPVFLASALHGLDDQRWDNSMEVDLDRKSSGTDFQTFGSGPHRCPGAALARSEIILFLEEWLKRIPDFRLDPDHPMVAASGSVTGVLSLRLKWDVPTK